MAEHTNQAARGAARQRLRWFGAELLVVATGVLIALAAQGWWTSRQDRIREQVYLRQLSDDLRRTDSLMTWADSVMTPSRAANTQLLRSFHALSSPPRDSLMHWLDVFAYYEAPAPVTGTAEALVATGELRLLRDAELRTAVTAYLGDTRLYTEESDRFVAMLLRGLERVWTEVDPLEGGLMWQAPIDSVASSPDFPLPIGARRSPFPIVEGAVLGNREVYNGVWLMQVSYVSLGEIRRRLRESNTRLTESVDAALAD